MAMEQSDNNDHSATTLRIKPGDFPFPLRNGSFESPYLTWIRNHSNYMGARGLLDYLRAAALLTRGMIINFLIFLPVLLIVSIVLAFAHHWMRAHPFYMTFVVFAVAVAWILIFPAAGPLHKIATHTRSLETGSESTVKQRDLYERSFGALLLAIFVCAALESLPWILEYLHDSIQLRKFGWQGGAATATTVLAVLSGANKLLSGLGGVKKKLAMFLVGILGLLLPLIVILTATNFLLYGLPPSPWWMLSPLAVPVVGVLGIIIAIVLGMRQKAFTSKENFAVLGMLVIGVLLAGGLTRLGLDAVRQNEAGYGTMAKVIHKVDLMAAQFKNVANKQEMQPELAAVVAEFVSANHAVENASEDLSQAESQYISSRMPYVSLGNKLSEQPDNSLAPLRREITRLAYSQLHEKISQDTGSEDRVAELLLNTLVKHYLPSGRATAVPSDFGDEDEPIQTVRKRFKRLVEGFDHNRVIEQVKGALKKLPTQDIVIFTTEEKIAQKVATKFDEGPGKVEATKLHGKKELATLLTKDEILDLLFPIDESERRRFISQSQRKWFLEEVIPQFPKEGTQDFHNKTLEMARELALLAKLRPVENSSVTDEAVSRSLALFYRTRAYLAQEDEEQAKEPVVGAEPTMEEIARVAGERLANRAIDDFDVNRLRALAFGEMITPEPAKSLEQTLTADWEAAWQDANKNIQLRQFLTLQKKPLEELAQNAFASPLVSDPVANAKADAEILDQLPYQLPEGHKYRVLLAEKALGNDTDKLASLARLKLIDRATSNEVTEPDWINILEGFATHDSALLGSDELARIAVSKIEGGDGAISDELVDNLVTYLMFSMHGRLNQEGLANLKVEVTNALILPKVIFLALLAFVIWLGCWLTVDVNLTSIHGLYRDRLASAFLVGQDTKGDINIEDDIDLDDICHYEAGSTAPYHLINVALNLQGSKDIGIRDRMSDFFIFSKRFIGSARTGYCRSTTMEQVFPQIDVATAMAVSAAAASPNMGRGTSPFLVAFMTLLNVRLGFWLPNPGLLEERLNKTLWKVRKQDPEQSAKPMGFTFGDVFVEEMREIKRRREQTYPGSSPRLFTSLDDRVKPTVEHGLVGIGYSGGGIRSASLNLGITQALHKYGVFDHVDYMSTVSGGGYLGSSITTLMRTREKLFTEIAGTATIETKDDQTVIVTPTEVGEATRRYQFSREAKLNVKNGEQVNSGKRLLMPRIAMGQCEIDGTVSAIDRGLCGISISIIAEHSNEYRDYHFSRFDSITVKQGEVVKAGQELIQRHDTIGGRFRWRVRPVAFLLEMLGELNETRRWVNLSDGGHIENLATIELLRRRCKYIIVGDGEADPNMHFNGLATLMRCAEIDFGIKIDIDIDALRLRKMEKSDGEGAVSAENWAIGKITYPEKTKDGNHEEAYLLYFKSSFTGRESETIREYRHRNPTFPHQTTADQFFDEDQFESYRALGQRIAEQALRATESSTAKYRMSFDELAQWFNTMRQVQEKRNA